MRKLILAAAWVTPALIAGMLGWSGIWGTGSALAEYLVPVPVAGGALHVPSFAVAAALIIAMPRLPATTVRLIAAGALAVAAGALSLQVDFERLNAWLFTDFEPFGSPLRLDGNALLLFVTTDAAWVGVAALATAGHPVPVLWLAVPVTAAAVFGIRIGEYRTGGPVFAIGGGMAGPSRGDEIELVFTSSTAYDESLFRGWLEDTGSFARPWNSPNSEHIAVVFTNSRQVIEWRQFDRIDDPATVGTACLYEEDMSVELHPGFFDCFAARETVGERLESLSAGAPTGFGADVDRWAASVRLCDGVEVPDRFTDVELFSVCRALRQGLDSTLERLRRRYGDDSEEVAFVIETAAVEGIDEAAAQ